MALFSELIEHIQAFDNSQILAFDSASNFGECKSYDQTYLGQQGRYWRLAYKKPVKGDLLFFEYDQDRNVIVYDDETAPNDMIPCIIVSAGVFTFNMVEASGPMSIEERRQFHIDFKNASNGTVRQKKEFDLKYFGDCGGYLTAGWRHPCVGDDFFDGPISFVGMFTFY